MQTLKDLTLDKLINLYEGVVVHDRKQIEENGMDTMGHLSTRSSNGHWRRTK